jgi:hypothetical protein
MRQKHNLTTTELSEWRELPQDSDEDNRSQDAWVFWNKVCWARGLDSASLIGWNTVPGQFSALPLGHKLHWCFPTPLKCKRRPVEFEVLVAEGNGGDAR